MFESLAGFMLNPAMAIGTGAVASPILIHLLSKRRFRRVRWGAMDFLLDAQRRNRRRVRFEQLLLLFLRCLAVFLIALLMTRPFVRPGALTAILGTAPRTERVVLLDDSYSMKYRPASGSEAAGESVFKRGVQAVEQIARWVSDETPGDSLTIYVMSNPRDPIIALPSLSDENVQRLRERLAELRPSQTVAHVAEGISAVADLIRSSATQANAAVYVVSDFQRKDWVQPSDGTDEKPRSVIAPLGDLAEEEGSVRLVLVNVGDPSAGNTAISQLVAGQPQIVAGIPARFEVTVSNYSDRPLNQLELSVSVAEHRLPPVVLPKIQPGQQVREPIEITFPLHGSDYLRVELAGAVLNRDALLLDNTRAIAVEVVPAVRVLLVDGEASNDPYRDEVYLLKTALRPAGRAASGNELDVVDEQELDDLELGDHHVIILANVGRLSKTGRRNVERFVRAGGGLIVFAGDQVDIAHYNETLYRGGEGVMPVALVGVAEPPPSIEAITFANWDADHPVMRAFVNRLAEVLRQVRVHAYISVDETSLDRPVTGNTSQPVENQRAPARVIARFGDADESPAIVQRAFGRGLSVFIATSADQEWNDWASNFSYLPLVLELIQYVAKQADTPGEAVVNGPIACPLDARSFKTTARLRTPGYPMEPEFTLEAVSARDKGPSLLTFADTDKAGLYRFSLTATTGEEVTRYAAVNPDPAESNLARANKIELDETLVEMPFEYLSDIGVLVDRSANAKQELWWPLLLAAVLVLMMEHVLAWWFGTRG